jgi:hypothetical protein
VLAVDLNEAVREYQTANANLFVRLRFDVAELHPDTD